MADEHRPLSINIPFVCLLTRSLLMYELLYPPRIMVSFFIQPLHSRFILL